MLRDQGRGPWIVRKPRDAPRPHAVTHAERHADEVGDAAGVGIHGWRRVFLCPPVVVLANRVENRVPPRPGRKRDAVHHDRPREMRVIGVGDQLEAVMNGTNDHVAAPAFKD